MPAYAVRAPAGSLPWPLMLALAMSTLVLTMLAAAHFRRIPAAA